MGFLFGRRTLFILGAGAALAAVWRWRSARRARLDREWEAEISGAIDEGRSAGTP
jgi:hypothetical protein